MAKLPLQRLGVADAVVAPYPLWLTLSVDADARRLCCKGLFEGNIALPKLTALRAATNGGIVLGSNRFQQQIAAKQPHSWSAPVC